MGGDFAPYMPQFVGAADAMKPTHYYRMLETEAWRAVDSGTGPRIDAEWAGSGGVFNVAGPRTSDGFSGFTQENSGYWFQGTSALSRGATPTSPPIR